MLPLKAMKLSADHKLKPFMAQAWYTIHLGRAVPVWFWSIWETNIVQVACTSIVNLPYSNILFIFKVAPRSIYEHPPHRMRVRKGNLPLINLECSICSVKSQTKTLACHIDWAITRSRYGKAEVCFIFAACNQLVCIMEEYIYNAPELANQSVLFLLPVQSQAIWIY